MPASSLAEVLPKGYVLYRTRALVIALDPVQGSLVVMPTSLVLEKKGVGLPVSPS